MVLVDPLQDVLVCQPSRQQVIEQFLKFVSVHVATVADLLSGGVLLCSSGADVVVTRVVVFVTSVLVCVVVDFSPTTSTPKESRVHELAELRSLPDSKVGLASHHRLDAIKVFLRYQSWFNDVEPEFFGFLLFLCLFLIDQPARVDRISKDVFDRSLC